MMIEVNSRWKRKAGGKAYVVVGTAIHHPEWMQVIICREIDSSFLHTYNASEFEEYFTWIRNPKHEHLGQM